MLKLEELRLSKLLFFEKITPATEVPPEVSPNSCGRGDSFNLGIMTHPPFFQKRSFGTPSFFVKREL